MSNMVRTLKPGMRGKDVEAHKRAVARALGNGRLRTLVAQPIGTRQLFGPFFTRNVKLVQKQAGIPQTGIIGPSTHEWLLAGGWFDARALALYDAYVTEHTKPDTLTDFEELVTVMQLMSALTPGYLLGGGHGIPLSQVRYDQRLDCSSSTSKALWDAGMLHASTALLSWDFLEWGEPGKGERFTVYTNGRSGKDSHVWIRLHGTRWWRFDTSPHGDGGSGPRLRYLPRFTLGFRPRHWPGL